MSTNSHSNTKLNICFLCETLQKFRGGTESYYYRMSKALAERGHTIHIITKKGDEETYCKDFDHPFIFIHLVDFKELSFRGAWRLSELIPVERIRYSMAVAKKVNKIKRSHPIDIIQSPDWSLESFWLSILKKTPLFVRLHGTPDYYTYCQTDHIKPDFKTWLTWKMSKQILFSANGIISVSNDFARIVGKSLGYKKLIEVSYNGIDQTIYKPGNISKRENSVLFVGRLEQEKGIKVIAEAIPLVLKEFPDLKFIFAGRYLRYQNTQKTWKDHLLETLPAENLFFLGQIPAEDIVTCYQKSLISIFPSFYEPGGAASLESMACGCATIATRVGGFQENIEDGKDGLLIPKNNPEALADAIKKLLNDDTLREQISINAVAKITSKFNLHNSVDQTIQVYKRAVEKNNKIINKSQKIFRNQNQNLPFLAHTILRREIFKARYPVYFKEFQNKRNQITPEGQTLKPFDEHKCIFVHVPKCAGISISKSLFGISTNGHFKLRDYQLIFNPWEFFHYFKFTIVRNPWDRLFSAFTFLKKGGLNERDKIWGQENLAECKDFDTFVYQWLNEKNIKSEVHFIPQMEYLRLFGNQVGLNFIGAYENLDEDFNYLCNKLKINAELSRLNSSRPEKDDYRGYYTRKTREIVAKVYEDDIKSLGYSFDLLPPKIHKRYVK